MTEKIINSPQQEEAAKIQAFMKEYRELAHKYGYDFAPRIEIIKIQPNVVASNFNPNSKLNNN